MENPSVPFMEHPFHQIKIKHVSDKVKSRLRNGHAVRITPTEGEGLNLIVHSHRLNHMTRCMKGGKGAQIALHPEEIEANKSIEGEGIFGKKADNFLKKHGVKKLAYAVGSAVNETDPVLAYKAVLRAPDPVTLNDDPKLNMFPVNV